MPKLYSVLVFAVIFAQPTRGFTELPLPDATFFGQIKTSSGAPVGAGTLTARIQRGAVVVLTVPGVFIAAEGDVWYVIRVPLETNIGAPGPSGVGAREGDALNAVLLDGNPVELKSVPPILKAGLASRLDATGSVTPPGTLFFRGDCSPDLKLSITDAVRVLNFLFIAPEVPACLAACDSDGSGVLNITDGVYLLSFLFLGGSAPPVPGPQCGLDPNPSELGCAQTNCSV